MELDDSQKVAVSHMDGPLQVKAGPGSGKTRVIVGKVLALVEQGVSQDSILCMTFTEKAADEMRRRLHEKGVGDVWVGTMHALCLEILKSNSITTSISDDTIIFGEMARLAWCYRNIESLNIDEDVINLSRSLQKTCLKILNAIRLAKREMISDEDLEMHIKDTDAPQLKELLKVYRAYDKYKLEKNLIDYEDMVVMTVKYLEQDSQMLKHYGEKFRYVLVDEFQDNNYAQFMLASLLATSDNITVVGDEDQSIMGFQGAFGGIFEEFTDRYENQNSVILTQNYRCSDNISAVSTQLLKADAATKLKDMHVTKGEGEPVMVVAASGEAAERQFVADTIKELDVSSKSIAILCRTNLQCQKFAETLRHNGIPTTLAGIGNILHNTLVAQIISLLKIANSPYTSGLEISHILKIDGIHEHNIRVLNTKARYNRDESTDGIFSILEDYSGSDQDAEIQEIGSRLHRLADEAKSATVLEVLYKIMIEYTDAYKKNANTESADSVRNVNILNRLYRIAEDYTKHYNIGLSDFIAYLDLADDSTGDGEHDYVDTADAINIMTIHKSKGKEFDVVFVTGLYDDNLPGRYKPDEFEIPQELLKGKGRVRDLEEAYMLEQRHLLYVAMTRAKDVLYLTYPKQAKDAKKERLPSVFLDDVSFRSNPYINTIEHVGTLQNSLPPKDELDAEIFRIQEDACKAIRESRPGAAIHNVLYMAEMLHLRENGTNDGFDPGLLLDVNIPRMSLPPQPKGRLVYGNNLTLSATTIDTYQKCPLQFKYREILKVPQKPSIYTTKGSIIHDAIEQLANDQLDKREPNIAKTKTKAKEQMDAVRYMHDRPTFENVYSTLDDIIDRYVAWNDSSKNTLIGSEVKFEIMMDKITYTGRIDRIETDVDGNYIVVDFKTGKSMITKKEVTTHPQTNIYAAAIKDKYGSLPSKVSLYYLERDTFRDYVVDEQSLQSGLKMVQQTAESIIAEDFTAKPSKNACMFCPYKNICPSVLSE